MPVFILGVILLGCLALLMIVARRERAAILAQRRVLLDACLGLFDQHALTVGDDGFPGLTGRMGARAIRVELVPDTLTLRRLPQLWLAVTVVQSLPLTGAVAALARATGNEFYALAPRLRERLETPDGFATDILLRGDEGGQALLGRIASPVFALMADPRVKEVAATPRGVRAIAQAGEGRRGDHLLLRQCRFDAATVNPAMLLALVDGIEAIAVAATDTRQEVPG